MSEISAALVAAQADMPHLVTDSRNPHFNNQFLSLGGLMEQVRPILNKHGLAVLQFPTVVDGQPALRTRIQHVSGEFIEDTMLLLLDRSNPQGQGSGITYARRYGLQAALGLVADTDDDGEAAMQPARNGQSRTPNRRDAPASANSPW